MSTYNRITGQHRYNVFTPVAIDEDDDGAIVYANGAYLYARPETLTPAEWEALTEDDPLVLICKRVRGDDGARAIVGMGPTRELAREALNEAIDRYTIFHQPPYPYADSTFQSNLRKLLWAVAEREIEAEIEEIDAQQPDPDAN